MSESLLARLDALESELTALRDKEAIRDVIHRYCRGADRCDRQAFKDCYWEDGYDDHGFFGGNGQAFGDYVIPILQQAEASIHAITNAIIDLIGLVVFTIPLAMVLVDLSWPLFTRAFQSGEMSANAGGLIRWPVLLLLPVGFAVLALQGLSELIKRVAFLTGHRKEPFSVEEGQSDEEKLAAELAAEAEAKLQGAR